MGDFDNNESFETTEDTGAAGSSYYEQTPLQSAPDYSTSVEPEKESKVFGIISLVCGILGLLCSCCGWFGILLTVAAVVLGIISLKKENAKGMAIAGIVCGGIGLLIAIIVIVMVGALSSVDPDSIKEYVEQFENTL